MTTVLFIIATSSLIMHMKPGADRLTMLLAFAWIMASYILFQYTGIQGGY